MVEKTLSADGLTPPSPALSEPTKMDDSYVDWQAAIDPCQICSVSLKRCIIVVFGEAYRYVYWHARNAHSTQAGCSTSQNIRSEWGRSHVSPADRRERTLCRRFNPRSAELSEPTKLDDAYVYWREAIYLSHFRCTSLNRLIMVIFENHVRMCTSTLSTIKATEPRIYLHRETKPILQLPYRAGPKVRLP